MLLLLAFISGILTLLSPCVIPMIPIIFGGALSGNKYAKYLVLASLGFSIFIFTFLLKTSLLLFSLNEEVLILLSSGILMIVGLSLIFPKIYSLPFKWMGLGNLAQEGMHKSAQVRGFWRYIAVGASLGPLFGSCSPTYALILALILPASFLYGSFAILVYILGFLSSLLLVIHFGQRMFAGKEYIKNPESYFYKILGGIIVISSLLLASGFALKIEYIYGKITGDFVSHLEGELLEYFPVSENSIENQESVPVFQLANYKKENACSEDRCVNSSVNYSGDIIGQRAPMIPKEQEQIGDGEFPEHGDGLILVDFWTAGCVNCEIAQEKLESILSDESNSDIGLISIHSPELQSYRNTSLLEKEVERLDLQYPVYVDNDFKLFYSYKVRYWPTVFLLDQSGVVRYKFEGTHELDELQSAIDSLR